MDAKYFWRWVAILEDGTVFSQFAEDIERSILDVPTHRIREICLEPQRPHLPRIRMLVDLANGERGLRAWQVTVNALQGDRQNVRQLLTIAQDGKETHLLVEPDGSIIFTARRPSTIP